MVPAMESLAKGLKGAARVGAVDCSAHSKICQSHGVNGYPTIKLLGPDGAQDYNGPRSAKAMRDALVRLIPDSKVRIVSGSKDASLRALRDRHCKGGEGGKSKACVLALSAHSQPSALIKALAAFYEDDKALSGKVDLKYFHVDVGKDKQHMLKVLEALGVTGSSGSPSLLLIAGEGAPQAFSSTDAGFTQLHKWIQKHAISAKRK
jgi:hypothetical protein